MSEKKPRSINVKSLLDAVRQIARLNLLSEDEVREIVREAVFRSFHSKFDPDAELSLVIDEEKNIFELTNNSKMVVDDSEYDETLSAIQVPFSIAKKINPDVKIDDLFAETIEFSVYSKNLSQQIKQTMMQMVRERRKEVVWDKYHNLKGKLIQGVAQIVSPSFVIFKVEDSASAFMPSRSRNPHVPLALGTKTWLYVEDVLKESKDSQIIVSNASPEILRHYLELEVPEIADNIVEVTAISRAAGFRSKVVVRSVNQNVDPVGALIGNGAVRIKSITDALGGERIDVLPFSTNQDELLMAALAPARVIAIIEKRDDRNQVVPNSRIIITPNRHQTLAIGRGGNNVRLATEIAKFDSVEVISHKEAVDAGINFSWNGNINPAELAQVEAGERLGGVRRRPATFGARQGDANVSFGAGSVSASLFDEDIDEFHLAMENEQIVTPTGTEMFSEEELKKMEENFELGDDLQLPSTSDFERLGIGEDDLKDDDDEDK